MKIVLAGIIARYPFGGVTWCSLMYLLGLARSRPRGLLRRGHRRVHLRSGAERPLRGSRPTAPRYIHDALAPFGLGDRWSFVNYDGTYHGASRETVHALLRRRRSLRQPVGRRLVLARRVRAHSAQGLRRHRSGVHAAGARQGRGVVRGLLPRLRSPVHVRRQHRHAGLATCRPAGFTWHKTWQPVVTGLWRPRAAAARRPLHDRHDLEDRELHRRGRQQGPRVRQVHRPARAHAAPLRAGGQRPAGAAARSTAGRRWTRWACRDRCGTTATSSRTRRPSSASPSTPTCRTARAGSATAPSATWRPGRPALVQDTGWSAHLPHGEGLLGFSTPEEAARRPRPDRRATTTATRGAPPRLPASYFDAGRVLPRLLETAGAMTAPLRIAQVAPVATSVPPPLSGSIEIDDGAADRRPRGRAATT